MKKRFQNFFLPVGFVLILLLAFSGLTACASAEPTTDNTQTETKRSDDAKEITDVVTAFSDAYFAGDEETLKTYLTEPHSYDITVNTSDETITDISLPDLSEVTDKQVGDVETVSLQYRPSPDADSFEYLTMELVKQDDGWKVLFYGIEG